MGSTSQDFVQHARSIFLFLLMTPSDKEITARNTIKVHMDKTRLCVGSENSELMRIVAGQIKLVKSVFMNGLQSMTRNLDIH